MSGAAARFLRGLLAPAPLRPPGARAEEDFAALCIRCDRCLEVCPWGSLRPAGLRHGAGAGAPLVVAREIPCFLCMRCPPVCPTGALAPVAEPRAVRMGRAKVDPARCYSYLGILCRTCVDECPLQGEAIRIDPEYRPIVTERCVGCGICEHRCPVDGPAIRVVPGAVA